MFCEGEYWVCRDRCGGEGVTRKKSMGKNVNVYYFDYMGVRREGKGREREEWWKGGRDVWKKKWVGRVVNGRRKVSVGSSGLGCEGE